MTERIPIKKRLKELRTDEGISQKKLGILAGIDEFSASARVNQYEKGKHVPDFATVKRFAKVLHVPTCYFYAENDDLAKIIKIFDKLSSGDKIKFTKKLQSF